MIKIINGNLLNATEQVIGHQVNCMGYMGAGVALQLRNKHPDMYNTYKLRCISDNLCLGNTHLYQIDNGQYIANIFGQHKIGRGRQTNYGSLGLAIHDLKKQMNEKELTSLALPYMMGCGLGGGSWDIVYGIIENCFENSEIDVALYKI